MVKGALKPLDTITIFFHPCGYVTSVSCFNPSTATFTQCCFLNLGLIGSYTQAVFPSRVFQPVCRRLIHAKDAKLYLGLTFRSSSTYIALHL